MINSASRSLSRIRLDWILWVLTATYIAGFAVVFGRTLVLFPLWDMIAWLEQYAAYKRGGDFLYYLLLPQNEHRIVLLRLLAMTDVELLGGQGLAFIAAGVISLVGIFTVVWKEIVRSGEPAFGPATAIAAAIVFTVPNAMVCSVPILNNYPMTLFFVLLSIILIACKDTLHPAMLVLAIVAAICGTLTNAIGLLVWPILLWFAWRARAPWPWLIAICALTLLFGGVFVLDKQQVHGLSAGSITDAVLFWTSFVGLPWTRFSSLLPIGRFVGVGLSGVALMLGTLRLNKADRLETLAIVLVLFSLGCSAFAAIGRSGLDAPFIPLRYSIFMAPLHLALLFFVLRRRWLSEKAAIAVLAVFNAQQLFAGIMAEHVAHIPLV